MIIILVKAILFSTCVIYEVNCQASSNLEHINPAISKFAATGIKLTETNPYQFIVSIVVNKFIIGIGSLIKPNWVLTAFSFYDSNVTENHRIVVQRWRTGSASGQSIKVLNMFIHPSFDDDTCNYDAVLLSLEASFTKDVSLAPYHGDTAIPLPKSECDVVITYNGVIITKKMTIEELKTCSTHAEFNTAEECRLASQLLCIHTDETVIGAPLLHQGNIVGIMPSNMDATVHRGIVQTAQSYYEWVTSITSSVIAARSTASSLYLIKIYLLIFILLIRTLISY